MNKADNKNSTLQGERTVLLAAKHFLDTALMYSFPFSIYIVQGFLKSRSRSAEDMGRLC